MANRKTPPPPPNFEDETCEVGVSRRLAFHSGLALAHAHLRLVPAGAEASLGRDVGGPAHGVLRRRLEHDRLDLHPPRGLHRVLLGLSLCFCHSEFERILLYCSNSNSFFSFGQNNFLKI